MIFTPPVAFGCLWRLRQGSGVHLTATLVQILLAQVSTGGAEEMGDTEEDEHCFGL